MRLGGVDQVGRRTHEVSQGDDGVLDDAARAGPAVVDRSALHGHRGPSFAAAAAPFVRADPATLAPGSTVPSARAAPSGASVRRGSGLLLNISSIRSVTRKPPTTLI